MTSEILLLQIFLLSKFTRAQRHFSVQKKGLFLAANFVVHMQKGKKKKHRPVTVHNYFTNSAYPSMKMYDGMEL
jgi:hypothetical protein